MARGVSATDKAYFETKSSILDGVLAGGDLITEGQVSASLGISRTPVREAFLRLQAEGLLQLYPKRGAVVSPVAPDEVNSVVEAREIIEVHVVTKLLTEHDAVPEPLLEQLWEIVNDMMKAVTNRDDASYLDADGRFHRELVASAINPFLDQMTATLRERQLRMARARGKGKGAEELIERSYQEHVVLVQNLERGDLDATLSVLRSHLRNGRNRTRQPVQ